MLEQHNSRLSVPSDIPEDGTDKHMDMHTHDIHVHAHVHIHVQCSSWCFGVRHGQVCTVHVHDSSVGLSSATNSKPTYIYKGQPSLYLLRQT